MKTVSQQYMKSLNKKTEEKIVRKRENLWRMATKENDEILNNKKALGYLLNKIKKTAISNHPSLTFTLCHLIFFE